MSCRDSPGRGPDPRGVSLPSVKTLDELGAPSPGNTEPGAVLAPVGPTTEAEPGAGRGGRTTGTPWLLSCQRRPPPRPVFSWFEWTERKERHLECFVICVNRLKGNAARYQR